MMIRLDENAKEYIEAIAKSCREIMEINTKIICYIYFIYAMTILIEIIFGNYIVYVLKCKIGRKIKARIVELNSVFRAQQDVDVSVLEYDNNLYALPYNEKDKLGDEIVIYVYGKYVVRQKKSIGNQDKKVIFVLSIVLLFSVGYIIMNWNGKTDLLIVILCLAILIIYIIVYPYIYYLYLYRIRKKLGWKLN